MSSGNHKSLGAILRLVGCAGLCAALVRPAAAQIVPTPTSPLSSRDQRFQRESAIQPQMTTSQRTARERQGLPAATSSSQRKPGRLTGPTGGVNPFLAQTPGGAPARARPQAKSKLPGRPGAGRAASTAGAVGNFPKYVLSPLIQSETAYFASSDVAARVGGRFSTPIVFFNPNAHAVDRVELWIRYNPELLDPVWVNLGELETNLKGAARPQVLRSQGYVQLVYELAPPLSGIVLSLGTINWSALHATANTPITIEAPSGERVGVYEGESNLLELSKIGNQGLVSMQARIVDEDADDGGRAMNEISVGEDPYLPAEREGRGVHLALVPAEEEVHTGEISTVDVALINPDVVAFDELRLRIRFDPQAVDILDADEGNYITDGVNIYDGGFHERMPFEFEGKNWVDPSRGIIEYIVGSTQGLRSYPSGTVARIVFRMKREAGSTFFWFEGLEPLTGQYRSDVRARGRSLLGPATGRAAEGLHNAAIGVAPL